MKVIAVIGALLVLIKCILQEGDQNRYKNIVHHSSLQSFAVPLVEYSLLGVFFAEGGECAGELCCALECTQKRCRDRIPSGSCSNSSESCPGEYQHCNNPNPTLRTTLHTSTPLRYTMHCTLHILQPSAPNPQHPDCEWLLKVIQGGQEASFALALFKVYCKRKEWLEVAEYFTDYPWNSE